MFNKLPPQGAVTWNVMIFGLVKCGQRQKQCGTIPTNATGRCAASPCYFWGGCPMCVPALLHFKRAGLLTSRLLKVGRIQISLSGVALLTCMPSVGAWRRLGECSTSCHLEILSLGMPCFKDMPRMGVVRKLLKHFDQMCEEGVQPNDITFHSVLSACSCGGLVDEGWRCYASMSNHSQTPFRVCLL